MVVVMLLLLFLLAGLRVRRDRGRGVRERELALVVDLLVLAPGLDVLAGLDGGLELRDRASATGEWRDEDVGGAAVGGGLEEDGGAEVIDAQMAQEADRGGGS